jgi:hypothetical protein
MDTGMNIRDAFIGQENICHKLSIYEYIKNVWEVVKNRRANKFLNIKSAVQFATYRIITN